MEQVIGKLLEDFERGRMTRRQLIHSLALAAGAASAAATVVNGQTQRTSGFKAIDVNHISYQVKDYRKTRDFYADLLGMTVSHDDGQGQCYLHFGNLNAKLLARNARDVSSVPRVDHIGYTIEPWNKAMVEAELKRRALDPRPDGESFHVKDPDGYDLQIGSIELGRP